MRSALRASIVTAALAGVFLMPAATAFAAPGAQNATPVSAAAASTPGDDRYDGEVVLVGEGRIAVLRNKSEGPEVWIRAVAPDWKPADGWAGRVLAKLDPSKPRAVVDGVEYTLTKTDGGRYGLNVHVVGEGASNGFYLLPKGTTTPSGKGGTATPKPTASPAVAPAPKAQNAGQTSVVPKGAVAAGAEIPAAAAEDTDNGTTVAAGVGLIAIFGALGASVALRRRRAQG
ncbi:hypothetical protein [Streptomyces sp. NBC_00162]|uniref:hypothetical protein n=1 Tax=Streptomyces sp. NBC_00162 TaxID=2903629 RepID=UPI00214CE747|nr:hypothetical protein [Streptomyces sp. NBC_00162]UUU40346.1 hypothetical protein JIW86_16930 [Streptomyces sp. NBC_00162]